MNKVQSFINKVLGEVRIIPAESGNQSETLFCALDICRALNYNENSIHNAIKAHCNGVSKQQVIDSLGREQTVNFIPLMDVFNLAFSSRRPEALELRRWITDEVLPALYYNGIYTVENHDNNFSLQNPIFDKTKFTEDIIMSDNNVSGYDSCGEVINLDFTPILTKIYDMMSNVVFPVYENQMKLNSKLDNIESNSKKIIPAKIINKGEM